MKWASTVSRQQTLKGAIEECVSGVLSDMSGVTPDLAVVFGSGHFAAQYEQIPAMIQAKLGPVLLFGCSAGGVIGGGREVENSHGFSLTVAHLPDVELLPFHLEGDELPDMDAGPDAWEKAIKVSAEDNPRFLLLIDPFSFPAQNFVGGLDYAFSRSVKIGGLASGGRQRGENGLFLGDKVYRSGAVGIAMKGNIAVDTIVA